MSTKCSSLLLLRLLILGLCLGGTRLSQAVSQASATAIPARISTIIRESLSRGEGTTVDGRRCSTRVPPSSEDGGEIKRYGDQAIPVLEEYILAQDIREGDLALRFLGLLGGSRIVEPLKRVVEKSSSPGRREGALRWLTQAP